MLIKSITIQGEQGDVEIARTDEGALITTNNLILGAVGRFEDREKRYEKARAVAGHIYGRSKRGVPNATNSMIHDVLNEIERIAGC